MAGKRKDKRMRWHAIVDRVGTNGKLVGAEIGVWQGNLSRKLLEMIPGLTLYMVDTWTAYTDEQRSRDYESQLTTKPQREFDRARKQAREATKKFHGRTVILEIPSVEAAARFEDGSLDFVYIDADHTYEGVTQDIEAWMSKVKSGGLLCGHDYGQRVGVTRAVDEWFAGRFEKDANSTWHVIVS